MTASKNTVPAEAPLAMPLQCFRTRFRDPSAPALDEAGGPSVLQLSVFVAVIALSGLAAREILAILRPGGLTLLEIAAAIVFTLTFVGIAIGCVTSVFGAGLAFLSGPGGHRSANGKSRPISVAVLVLTYNEDPEPVFARVTAMLRALAPEQGRHWFSFYVLSDTTDAGILAREAAAFATARQMTRGAIPVHYRHRSANHDRKVGNLRDWCTRWGGHHDGMLVLDADSLMGADAIVALADALSDDPGAGLIQSVPRITGDRTAFARFQAFANALTGQVFARGLARWVGGDSNYWGHNAIIRTRAFAAAAGLPHLSGRAPYGGLVFSHDFVEAALIRRAGWRVHLRPDIVHSYEEAPETLDRYIERDNRWCQGNLQHIRLLMARGFRPLSRFHLLNGIMAYLSAPLWAVFLAIGAVIAHQGRTMPIDYFPDPFALFPTWPVLDSDRALTLLALTLAVLLTPRIMGLAVVLRHDPGARRWGGWGRLLTAFAVETLTSALVAPILMVHQCRAILRVALGRDGGWRSVRRSGSAAGRVGDLARFHAFETGLGLVMLVLISIGLLTLLVLPIAASLALSIPLSMVLGRRVGHSFAATPDRRTPPSILGMSDYALARFPRAAASSLPVPSASAPVAGPVPVSLGVR